jgi:hypothetical protein
MLVNICHHNTQGLANDAEILTNAIKEISNVFDVKTYVYEELDIVRKTNITVRSCDFQIFLEHVFSTLEKFAKQNVLIPNIEWINKEDIDSFPRMHSIVAKTKLAHKSLSQITKNVVFWGWISRDRLNESIDTDYGQFLHLKGISQYKQTQMVLNVWSRHPTWPPLSIVSYGVPQRNGFLELPNPVKVAKNITLYQKKLDDQQVVFLLNSCGVHLCPSLSEGFGHYISEGMSCKACVVTTKCPPMNEHVDFSTGFLIPTSNICQLRLGLSGTISEQMFENCIYDVLQKNSAQLKELGSAARVDWDTNRTSFLNNVTEWFTKQLKNY